MASPHEQLLQEAITQHQEALVRYVTSILRDEQPARDVVQDAYMRLWEQQNLSLMQEPRLWLFTVCRNRALDTLRSRKHLELSESGNNTWISETPTAEQTLLREERSGLVRQALLHLTGVQQEMLRLKFSEDLSYKEIAVVTGKSVSNVGVTIHNALQRLQQILRDMTLDTYP